MFYLDAIRNKSVGLWHTSEELLIVASLSRLLNYLSNIWSRITMKIFSTAQLANLVSTVVAKQGLVILHCIEIFFLEKTVEDRNVWMMVYVTTRNRVSTETGSSCLYLKDLGTLKINLTSQFWQSGSLQKCTSTKQCYW